MEAPAGAAPLRERLLEETGRDCFVDVLASVGDQPMAARGGGPGGLGESMAASHVGEVAIELLPTEQRTYSSEQLAFLWRAATGPVPGSGRGRLHAEHHESGERFARILPASSASRL